jgi:hypothetical protein
MVPAYLKTWWSIPAAPLVGNLLMQSVDEIAKDFGTVGEAWFRFEESLCSLSSLSLDRRSALKFKVFVD